MAAVTVETLGSSSASAPSMVEGLRRDVVATAKEDGKRKRWLLR